MVPRERYTFDISRYDYLWETLELWVEDIHCGSIDGREQATLSHATSVLCCYFTSISFLRSKAYTESSFMLTMYKHYTNTLLISLELSLEF